MPESRSQETIALTSAKDPNKSATHPEKTLEKHCSWEAGGVCELPGEKLGQQ